ncbi:MAG: GNAT family N-acetyltransferase [Clostridia bacterium]|nr:GNAT family N-acetyltransferase [Clostridia bacterium]
MSAIKYINLTIRPATAADVPQLAAWWNDGKVMAHAGFPLGLGISEAEVAAGLSDGSLIIEENGLPIGECNFRPAGDRAAEIGIKICEASAQNRGLGKIILSLLIRRLFDNGFEKIVLDTNPENHRACRVYEALGFKMLRINADSWRDQLGRLQSSTDYKLIENNFVDFSHIHTPRLLLRPFAADDLAQLHEIFSDPETMEHIEPPFTLEKTAQFLHSFCIERGGALACVHKESGKMIGYVLFKATEPDIYEIGWIFNRRFWRNGYAYEACSALIRRAFERLGAEEIFAETNDSQKSLPLMEKLGMGYVGLENNMHLCCIKRKDYETNRNT